MLSADGDPRPVVVVLVAHWESTTEEGWITRQVAGALSIVADVHIVTPDGPRGEPATDGAFTVHRVGTPVPRSAEIRRDLLVTCLAEAGPASPRPLGEAIEQQLDLGLVDPWTDVAPRLKDLAPDLVLIAGHHNVGALAALDNGGSDAPMIAIAFGAGPRRLTFPHFDPVLERAAAVLTVTEGDQLVVAEHLGMPGRVHRTGAPMKADASALSEPNPWVGRTDYVLVVTSSAANDDDWQTQLSRLLRLRFPDNPIGIAHRDAFCVWHRGRLSQGWPIERASDMARLVAWARLTVDLDPGPLFARRCVLSLLYGTPIVVPSDSRAREHASRGGGLWFASPAELDWCVEEGLRPDVNATLGTQGRRYAEAEFGSTERFVSRVLTGCGLTPHAEGASVSP